MSQLLKNYLWAIFFASLLFGLTSFLIIFKTDPYASGNFFVTLFFISLFLTLTGIFFLLGFYLRVRLSRREIIYAHLLPAARQAILLSLYLVGLLGLQIFRLVNIWTASLFLLIILALELIFKVKKF